MEDRYYKPESSEFRIGFEYELLDDNGKYCKEVFNITHSSPYSFDDVADLVNLSRVKYLDREDVKSLGFKLGNERYPWQFVGYPAFRLTTQIHTTKEDIPIGDKITISDSRDDIPYFYGIIKNKSELKIILKQIGYEQ